MLYAPIPTASGRREVFVRDCFDAFFDHLQMIQQQITNKMFELEHIRYPVGYFSTRMLHPLNWPAVKEFLEKYEFPLALKLITDIGDAEAIPVDKDFDRDFMFQRRPTEEEAERE